MVLRQFYFLVTCGANLGQRDIAGSCNGIILQASSGIGGDFICNFQNLRRVLKAPLDFRSDV